MDKLSEYKETVKNILNYYVELDRKTPEPNMEYFLIADDENGQYLWKTIGWEKDKHVDLTTVYIRLKNDKIYIEEDWTEEGIATDLLRAGIPKKDIVLAFHEPSLRKYTEFAVA
ncbi:MAG: XisI protein [Acidobacteria bacterium]|jgi:hypothetical protein|nr:XisI protein [Acidobacteriota bacterium]MBA4184319.1 XisI protein [Acidobacteriota bacterium]